MEQEFWKDIPGFEGRYQASSIGRIRSLDFTYKMGYTIIKRSGVILTNSNERTGYLSVMLADRKRYSVHRLVALAFVPNPESKPEVNHIDFDRQNNNVNNLEWCTQSENRKHSVNNGRLVNHLKRISKIACASNCKPVIQMDKENNYINQFPSIINAANTIGVSSTGVWSCVKGRHKSCGGFKWKYA